jgi:hypothetical protein
VGGLHIGAAEGDQIGCDGHADKAGFWSSLQAAYGPIVSAAGASDSA